MVFELIIQNSNTGAVYDVTTLAGNIQYTTDLSGQPGKFTFSLQQDPNNILEISSGSIVSFAADKKGIFFGYVFIMGTDATGIYKITAYDQMRYLKNQETMYTENASASKIFEDVCTFAGLQYSVITPTSWIVPEYFHDKKSLYQIIENGITNTNINDKKQYFIKDDFGTLLFTEIGEYKTNLIIGDRSLLTDYKYEISIDKDTYNTVKITKDNEETGKRDVWIEYDSSTKKRWGKLQYLFAAGKDDNEAEIKQFAQNVLKAKNRETKTMKLNALGVRELVAGTGFLLQIDKLNIKQYMWITAATHNYEKDFHTMSLDVFI